MLRSKYELLSFVFGGRLDVQMDRRLDVQTSRWIDVQTARCLDGQKSGWLDGQKSRWIEVQMDGWLEVRTSRWMDVQKSGWLEVQMDGRLDGQQGIDPAPVENRQVLFRCITSVKYLFDISRNSTRVAQQVLFCDIWRDEGKDGEIWGGLGGLAGNNGFAIEFGGRVEKIYRVGHHTLPPNSMASYRNMVRFGEAQGISPVTRASPLGLAVGLKKFTGQATNPPAATRRLIEIWCELGSRNSI